MARYKFSHNAKLLLLGLASLSSTLIAAGCSNDSTSGSTELIVGESSRQISVLEFGKRDVNLTVTGLRIEKSIGDEHRVCGIALSGQEGLPVEEARAVYKAGLVCSSEQSTDGSTKIKLPNVPYPSYIFVFHDENINGLLDFAVFDLLIIRRDGPAEGVGTVSFKDQDEWPKGLSRPVWVEEGLTELQAELRYEDLPFLKTVKEGLWELFYLVYTDLMDDLAGNNEKKVN